MTKINSERLEIGERFEEFEHRLYYTRFAKKMVKYREYIEKSARKLRNNAHLSEHFKSLLKGLDELNQQEIYSQFKAVPL